MKEVVAEVKEEVKKAPAKKAATKKAVEKAFKACNDIIVFRFAEKEEKDSIENIYECVKSKKIKEHRINKSVNRILKMKEKYDEAYALVDENEKIIVFTGRQHPVKGLYQLFQAFENVYQKERNIRLVIIGKNPNVEEYTKLMPTALSRVIFTGYIKQSDIVDWYRAADIGILPSYNEQCSYSGIEMLMLGMLVVSTDSQGLTDMFHDNENALVAKIGNRKDDKDFIASLTETIQNALSLPKEKTEELSANAKKYAQEKYSISKMQEKYLALIEDIYKQ